MSKGRIEVITGPMFAGKTEELIRRLRRATIAKQRVLVFKPHLDTRSGNCLSSHSKQEFPALCTDALHPEALLDQIDGAQVIGIEEVQFFAEPIADILDELTNQGRRIIVAGLDLDAWGRPFGQMPTIMATAERVDKLVAVCTVCGGDATRSQKITSSATTVDIGAGDKYEARCRDHFAPPDLG